MVCIYKISINTYKRQFIYMYVDIKGDVLGGGGASLQSYLMAPGSLTQASMKELISFALKNSSRGEGVLLALSVPLYLTLVSRVIWWGSEDRLEPPYLLSSKPNTSDGRAREAK